jgi:hypothetical protein
MTTRRTSAYIDAIAAGQRPRWGRSQLEHDDVAVVRTAIELRAARPGDSMPSEEFVAGLRQQLAEALDPSQPSNIQTLPRHRGRAAVFAAAAAVALIGGTIAVTEATNRGRVTNVALPAPHGRVLRTGTFETARGQVLGQIVVYQGRPSWVYMNVNGANTFGSVKCELHMKNGAVVAAGTVHLRNGRGFLSHTVSVDAGQLRDATLYSRSGAVLGSATLT